MNANPPTLPSGSNSHNLKLTATTLAQEEIFLIEETHQQANCWLSFSVDINGQLDVDKLARALEHLGQQVPCCKRVCCIRTAIYGSSLLPKAP